MKNELVTKNATLKGRINVLERGVPQTSEYLSLSIIARNDLYWEKINKPYIDEIIANGGDIRFIHDPRLPENQWNYVADMPDTKFKEECINEGLDKVEVFLKREYEYLLSKGYVLREDGLTIKP